MAKLSPAEREQLRRPFPSQAVAEPRMRRLTPAQYVDFVTQASRMGPPPRRPRKPITGEHWKL